MAYVLMKLYHARIRLFLAFPPRRGPWGEVIPFPILKIARTPLSFLNSSEFVDLHRTVPRSRWTAGYFRILIFLPRGEECGAMKKK
jgi:hypothetical protein